MKFLIFAIGFLILIPGCSDNKTGADSLSTSAEVAQKLYVGDIFKYENIEASITAVEKRDFVGNEFLNKKVSKNGVFIVVQWEYKNISDKPIGMFDKTGLTLVDTNGIEYQPDIDATSSFSTESNNDEKVFSELNPGISVKGANVFEVAADKFNDNWKAKVGNVLVNVTIKQPKEAVLVENPKEITLAEQVMEPIQNDNIISQPNPIPPETQDMSSSNNQSVKELSEGPSFDCAKSSNIIESLICSNQELAKLDLTLSLAYQDAKSSSPNDIESLKAAQLSWLKTRNDCTTIECLKNKYQERHQELAPWDYE